MKLLRGLEVEPLWPLHERASDRVAEAVQNLDAEIVVMVQGDEPMTIPAMIEQAVAPRQRLSAERQFAVS